MEIEVRQFQDLLLDGKGSASQGHAEKRSISSIFLCLIFGFVFPSTVRMLSLLKEIWKKHGQSWTDDLSQEDETISRAWASELSQVNKMAFSRKYLSANAEVVDLQDIAEAFLEAMCIVAYFRHQQTGRLAYVGKNAQ